MKKHSGKQRLRETFPLGCTPRTSNLPVLASKPAVVSLCLWRISRPTKSNRKRIFDAHRTALLPARYPPGHRPDNPDGLVGKPFVGRPDHAQVAQRTVFLHHELHDHPAFHRHILRYPGRDKSQTTFHVALRKRRHLFDHVKTFVSKIRSSRCR